jgi:hypothetical protein
MATEKGGIYPDGWIGDPGSEGIWPENDDGP